MNFKLRRDWFQLTLKEGLTVYRDQVGFALVIPSTKANTVNRITVFDY